MDQIKIGKFISSKRKEKNITQAKLAEMLYISERSISKWENGVCMPDVGTMPELCKILEITINDLFSGEVIDMKDNEKVLEQNLMDMASAKEAADKRLLNLEIVIGILVSITMFALIFIASFVEMQDYIRVLLIIIGILQFAVGMYHGIKIEQVAGYYECSNCHHKYVPTYINVLFAPHINRTRRMKCPKCGKKSWNKKVLR